LNKYSRPNPRTILAPYLKVDSVLALRTLKLVY
jgi:hypothetical protein